MRTFLLLSLISTSAFADYSCFTHSNGILFRADGKEEKYTADRVVRACEEHGWTEPADCTPHLKCFEQTVNAD